MFSRPSDPLTFRPPTRRGPGVLTSVLTGVPSPTLVDLRFRPRGTVPGAVRPIPRGRSRGRSHFVGTTVTPPSGAPLSVPTYRGTSPVPSLPPLVRPVSTGAPKSGRRVTLSVQSLSRSSGSASTPLTAWSWAPPPVTESGRGSTPRPTRGGSVGVGPDLVSNLSMVGPRTPLPRFHSVRDREVFHRVTTVPPHPSNVSCPRRPENRLRCP